MAEPFLPVFINGSIVPADEARISVFDRGFMRGDALFETLRTYGGRIFRLDEHLARMDQGLDMLHYPARTTDLDLKAAAEETVRASGLESARVRIQVSRGAGSTEFTIRTDTPPTVVVTVQPLVEHPMKPLNVVIASIRRDERSPLSRIKTINYIPSLLAKLEAENAGADDAILLNYAGNVAEGCVSNVFIARDGVLMTPDLSSGVLPGTVRQFVMEIADESGIRVQESPVNPEQLYTADEVFMTSSTREIAPVEAVDGRRIGQGAHEIAQLLAREYRKRAEQGESDER